MKVFLLALLVCAVEAKVFQWIGANNKWSNGANWDGGNAPGATSVVSFPKSFSDFGTKGGKITIDEPKVTISKLILPTTGRISFNGNIKLTFTGKASATSTTGTPVQWAVKSPVSQNPSCPNNWGLASSDPKAPTKNVNHDIPCADDDINFETSSLQIIWRNNTYVKSIKIKDEFSQKIFDISESVTGYESTFQGVATFVRNGLEEVDGLPVSRYCIKASSPECDFGDDVIKAEEEVKKKELEVDKKEKELEEIKVVLNVTTDPNDIIDLQKQILELQKQIQEALLALKEAREKLLIQINVRDAATTASPEKVGEDDKDAGGLPIIPVAAGAGGALLLILLLIFITRRRRGDREAAQKDTAGRSVVAFENPMYEGAGKGDTVAGSGEDGQDEGLYDEPAYAQENLSKTNPMYTSQEQLYAEEDEDDDDTGYLDVNPTQLPADTGYLDMAEQEPADTGYLDMADLN